MTRDDIIRMAREAGVKPLWIEDGGVMYWGDLHRFADVVAAAEREECAKVCDERERANLYGLKECAALIRERGVK